MPRLSATAVRKALPRAGAAKRAARPAGTLTALVTGRIREAIVDGRFALGEALSELKLAAALNVSRTPVRDALTALQIEGLIEVRPQSGSFVFLPSDEGLAELAEFRHVLEVTALRLCFARRRDAALRAMRSAADAMERASDVGDHLGVARGDAAFHQAIAGNSANEYLVDAYRMVSGRVAALRAHNLMAADAVRDKALAEHRSLIAAFAKGDLRRAESVLAAHIRRMRERFQAARAHAGAKPPE